MFTRLNTILIPEEKAQKIFLQLASSIFMGKNELFYIDNKKYFAHVTLYSPEYPNKNVKSVFDGIEKIKQSFQAITLTICSIESAYGYIVIEFSRDETIAMLHKEVLETLNPLREGRVREKYKEEIKSRKYTQMEIKNIKNYGYHNVLNDFHPHLTLGRFENPKKAEKVAADLKLPKGFLPIKISFPFLAVSEMGLFGTCTKIIKKFTLQS